VCEKSDGIRYLLYMCENDAGQEIQYLIDRKNDYWYIPPDSLHLPLETDEAAFHKDTLVDGELVMDDMGNGELQPKFLVFDCLVLDGKDLKERTLDKRLGYFGENVFKPYTALFNKYPNERSYQVFHLEMKDMQFSYGIEMMFRDVLPRLKHGNDGLIFTCRNTEYHPGTDQHILKWKPATENTIDFQIRLRFKMVEPDEEDIAEGYTEPYPDYYGLPFADLYTYHGGQGPNKYQYFAELHLTEEDWEAIKGCNDPVTNRIVECSFEDGVWRVHRFRDDKPQANHIKVVESILESIRDSVSKEELLAAAKPIKDNWKARQAQQKR